MSNRTIRNLIIAMVVTGTAGTLWAAAESSSDKFPKPGSVDRSTGLKAFERIYEVASHPRCSNCHVVWTKLWQDARSRYED